MRFLRKVICQSIILLSFIVLLCIPHVIYADEASGTIDWIPAESDKEYKELFQWMISNGFSKEAAAGVIGNSLAECSGVWSTVTGTCHGAFQLQGDRYTGCQTFCKSANLDPNSATGQFSYIYTKEMEQGFKTFIASPSLEEWKTSTDYIVGFEGFMASMERCVEMGGHKGDYDLQKVKTPDWYVADFGIRYQGGQNRKKFTEEVLRTYAGITPVDSTGSNLETAEGNPNNIVISAGTYYSEDALGKRIALTEENLAQLYLDMVDKKLLQQGQIEAVTSWRHAIEIYDESNGLTTFMRQSIIFIGFILTTWSILAYLSYWLDRLNHFGFINFLSLISFGFLRVSPDEDTSALITEAHTVRLVNHKAIIGICILCMGFGVFILTGKFYICVNALINAVRSALNI